jgi:hypothetical protein
VLNGGSPTVSSLDNAGVAAGLGPGSYLDLAPSIAALPSNVGSTSGAESNVGPLLGNPGQFVAPRGLTYGDIGRNYFRNPVQFNFDMTFTKVFKVAESKSLEFRIETYNTFNHTQFRIYDPANPGNTGNNIATCFGPAGNLTGPDYSAAGGKSATVNVNCLSGNAFLHPVDAHRPRTLQLAAKFLF